MADYLTTDTELASIANAIRTKGGTSAQLVYPTGFVSAIQAIPTGGGSAKTCTITISPDGDDVTCSNFSGGAPTGGFAAVSSVQGTYGYTIMTFMSASGALSFSEATSGGTNCTFAMNDSAYPDVYGWVFSPDACAFAGHGDCGGDYNVDVLSAFAGTYTATVIEF